MPPGTGVGRQLTDLEVFALLEERGKSKEQIGRMDPWWAINVIFYPRDEKGNLIPRGVPDNREKMDERQAFTKKLKDKGYADWQIDERWEALMEKRRGTNG